ncbi:unnamed protein product [Plutella xylostella]|uniref:(diamondback moth) hypothetical protein n=1 Tax=Plutella xylostella TaxID=51655 RepID=A0A8S4G912_PLUXY|nr:unnamed protein product [Plutella xylostella]
MKVKLAAQVLSNDMAAMLKLLAETYNDSKRDEILLTADVVEQLDKLFDATNGPASKKDVKKGRRENVSENSFHHKLWPTLKKKIQTMHFLKSDSELRLRNVRCVKGYLITISSLQDIWSYVKQLGFKFLNLRQLNQDSLENLFGLIRQHSPTNQNPTCHHFTAALKSTILTKLSTPIRGANCEIDDNQLILDFHDLVFKGPETKHPTEDHSYQSEIDEVDPTDDGNVYPELHLPDTSTAMEERLFESFDKQPVVYAKCLICLGPYTSPAVSIQCWHVYCEICWLESLKAKKICPQCNAITTTQHLRRIYM